MATIELARSGPELRVTVERAQDGQLTFLCDGRRLIAHEGDTITIPTVLVFSPAGVSRA